MLTKEQADEIKRLASEAAYEYLNNMIYSRTPDETNAERMNDYIDSLVGDDEPVAWRVECRWADRSKGGGWRKYADYGTAKAAETAKIAFANPGDIESRIVPLYAAPQPPVQQGASNYADAYRGAREDLLMWKRRALEAEELNRKFMAEINGPVHMGEPVLKTPVQQRKPMTEDEIWNNDELMALNREVGMMLGDQVRFVRIVERHHGITGDEA